MESLLERDGAPSEWGVEPVPPGSRVLSARDLAVLWGDLGIGLLVLVTGAILVPALGFVQALIAIALGSVIGVGLLGFAGSLGARHGVPTMALFRPVLGIRGSWLPSALNVMQLVGWTAVELWAMSYVADLVANEVFGFSARGLWLTIAAVVCTGLALWGPVGVTRVWLERFGVWVIVAISLVITVLLLTRDGIGDALTSPGTGGFPTFGSALDLVIAMPISWLPLVADYTRFAARPRAAFVGTFWGYLVANVWLYTLGALLVLTESAAPSPEGIAVGILAIAGGSVAGLLFLVGLLVGETDEAFADIYSGAVSLQNIFPRLSVRVSTIGIAAVATVLAAWLNMARYEVFLFLIGSVFVPLFGVLIAVYVAGRPRRLLDPVGEWNATELIPPGVRLDALWPWLAGFVAYHWVAPTGPTWWTDLVNTVFGSPLSVRFPWLSASLVAGSLSFALMWLSTRRKDLQPLSSSSTPTRGRG
ncbi:MAG: purine-cytosine permease family protein [Actinomycetota bacterium]